MHQAYELYIAIGNSRRPPEMWHVSVVLLFYTMGTAELVVANGSTMKVLVDSSFIISVARKFVMKGVSSTLWFSKA